MALEKKVQEMGLSAKETKVYLALLGLGQAPVNDIATKAGINRSTTYLVLDSLVEKRLCRQKKEKDKVHFIAEDPDSIKSYFFLRRKELEDRESRLKKIMPELRSLHNSKEGKPVVRLAEGREGIRSIVTEFIKADPKEELRCAFPIDDMEGILSVSELNETRKSRQTKKAKARVIYRHRSKDVTSPHGDDTQRLRIADDDLPLTCGIGMQGSKVAFVSFHGKLPSVFIEDKEIAGTLSSIFDLAWKGATLRQKKGKKQGFTKE